MRLGFADAGNDAPSTTTRKAYDLIADAYGPGTNGPFVVVVDTAGTTADAEATSPTLVTALGDAPRVSPRSTPPVLNAKGDLAIIERHADDRPQDEETSTLLARLRDATCSRTRSATAAETSASPVAPRITDDVSNRLQDRMPWFLGAVIGLSFLVLMLVFRSVLVPLKAAVLNVLSVGAAYGVIVAVFQWGWGREPDRRARERADHAAGTDADVRDPVRSVDGLRGVPAQPGARAVPPARRPEAGRRRGRRLAPARVITSAGAHHDRGLRRVHPDAATSPRRCSVSAWPSRSCST